MTWHPPFFRCGLCGGEIGRWPTTNLLRQEILDWRHRSVPEGVGPHRAVLGTPAHKPSTDLVDPVLGPRVEIWDEDGELETVPPPEIPARPATFEELPTSARSIDKVAAANGWDSEAFIMRGTLMDARWKPVRVRTSVVLRFKRDGHGLVAIWVEGTQKPWEFDGGFSVGHHLESLSSPELRAALGRPRALCESCGEPPALHDSTPTGPMCHADWVTHRNEGGTDR